MKPVIAQSLLWAAAILVTALLNDPKQSVPLMSICAVMSIFLAEKTHKNSKA